MNICNDTTYTTGSGYISLPVEVPDLPETVSVEGYTLKRKTEFHVSLLYMKSILVGEPTLIDHFCSFSSERNLSFTRYTGGFRFACKAEKRTLVALCEVANLAALFGSLWDTFSVNLPVQPTHVTLFTLQPDAGIGLNSPTEMESLSSSVAAPSEVRQALGV